MRGDSRPQRRGIWRAKPETRDFARALRHEPTYAERVLWEVLRGRRLSGHRFCRQNPVGPSVVDFYCAGAGLVVEVDGISHEGREAHDAERTAWLEAAIGLRVIRFTEDEVVGRTEMVAERILAALAESEAP